MAYVAGIDEAGRGPVLGPMVMAIVACQDQECLKSLGVKDSKLLSPKQRDDIAESLTCDKTLFSEIISLSPAQIDAAVQGENDTLNQLEARTSALLILRLTERIAISKVILDSPTKTTDKYERDVRAALSKIDTKGITSKIKLIAETKADFNHPVVGAASILAKTTRDKAIAEIAAKHGKIGSGYPADPDTQAFLTSQWREPHDFFRKSWESYRRLAEKRTQSSLASFGSEPVRRPEFDQLLQHGFSYAAPTNQYEVARLTGNGVTVIVYTTKKVLVQGPMQEKKATEDLLGKLKLMPAVGRPKKS